jgi:hypothetical protein
MKEFKYNVDTKYTVWERQNYYVKSDSKETADKLITNILNGEEVDDIGLYIDECEVIYDTIEYITPEENGGLSTIEVYDENGSLIYDNTTNKNNND